MRRLFLALALIGLLVACTAATRTSLAPGVIVSLGNAGKLVTSFALDATHVYWTTCYYADGTNAIGKVAKMPRGGGAETILAPDQPCPRNLALDASSVYWVNRGTEAGDFLDGAVMRVDKTGGAATPLASKQDGNASLAIGDAHVYWGDCKANTLWRIGKNGGAPTAFATQTCAASIALDASNVYWIYNRQLFQADQRTGTMRVLASGDAIAGALALNDDHLYWTMQEQSSRTTFRSCADERSRVYRIPKTGGETQLVATVQGPAPKFAFDAANIFLANDCVGGILRLPKSGGEPKLVIKDEVPAFLAVDAAEIFWAVNVTGDLKKAGK